MSVAQARERIREHADLRAFIEVSAEEGTGPVVAVKDVIDVRGLRTTAGALASRWGPWPDGAPRRDPAAPAAQDAPVVARLREHGCVVVGKTNLHEFCLGPTSENPHFGAVRNPVDPTRVAGGSSGGSAVAVALGMCDVALGTDTSGSVRIPASLCGVVGVKPTTGLVETTGTVPMSRTQDTIGPLARDVATAARALGWLTGTPPDLDRERGSRRWRFAVPQGWDEGLEPDVAAVWAQVAGDLPRVPVPSADRVRRAGTAIVLTEAAAVHRYRFAADPGSYGADVRELLAAGSGLPRERYVAALADAARLRVELDEVLAGWDALLLPATRGTAPPVGSSVSRAELTDLTRPFSVTGHPVVCLPAPYPTLPVGIQVVCRHGDDAGALAAAAALEAAWS